MINILQLTERLNDSLEGESVNKNQVWRLPYFKMEEAKDVKRANRYLGHMQRKILDLSRKGETKKIWAYGDILLRRSAAFKLWSYHKVNYGWYWKMPESWVKEQLKRLHRLTVSKETAFKVDRTYIQKSNGKWRPIGAPRPGDKGVMSGITEILKPILEPNIQEYQHGFITGRSMEQALMKLSDKVGEGTKVYQYDLKSYFNSINVKAICGRVDKLAPNLGKWIEGITYHTLPRIKEYREEAEVKLEKWWDQDIWAKFGFTQGAPYSPLLGNYALEFAGMGQIPGLIAYADDGVICRKEKDFEELELSARARIAGVELAEKDLGWAIKFKFLGFVFNTVKRTIETVEGEELQLPSTKANREAFIRRNLRGYTPEAKKTWIWEPIENSWTYNRRQLLLEKLRNPKKKLIRSFYKSDKHIYEWNIDGVLTTEVHVDGERDLYQHQVESTLAIQQYLKFMKEQTRKKRKQCTYREYKNPPNVEQWSDVQMRNGKIWIRYPINWGSLHSKENVRKGIVRVLKRKILGVKVKASY